MAVAAFVPAVEVRFRRAGIFVTNSGCPPSNMLKNVPPEARRAALDQLLMSTIVLPAKLCRGCRETSEDV